MMPWMTDHAFVICRHTACRVQTTGNGPAVPDASYDRHPAHGKVSSSRFVFSLHCMTCKQQPHSPGAAPSRL